MIILLKQIYLANHATRCIAQEFANLVDEWDLEKVANMISDDGIKNAVTTYFNDNPPKTNLFGESLRPKSFSNKFEYRKCLEGRIIN